MRIRLPVGGQHVGNMVMPDKITIFQRPIEARCRTAEELVEEIGAVVKHEIAHHFGISDATLYKIEEEKRRSKRSR